MHMHRRRRINRERIIERPAWVRQGMTVAYDFAGGRYFGLGRQFNSNKLTCTRASTADYAEDNRGWLRTFPAATPRVTNKGLLIEAAATNVLLRCRDLTQAAWTKTNITAALDQTGVDRTINSASSITATAGNAAVLQAVTLSSSSRRVSAYVKQLTGTGVVNMTTDGGSTWVAVTVTADWSRVDIPVQTVTNPSTGFQIVTSGDAIAVDFVQNETGPLVTSPILTGAASATRSLDVVKFAFLPPFYNPLAGTLWAEVVFSQVNSGGANQTIVAFDQNGSSANRIHLSLNNAGSGNFAVVAAGVTQASISLGAFSANVIKRCAAAWAANNFIAVGSSFLGVNDLSGTIPTLIDQLHFGDNVGTSPTSGFIRQIQYAPQRLPDSVLQSITR